MKIGIVGAGFIGRAVARLAIAHGHQVMISNSRAPRTLASTAASIKCAVGTAAEAAQFGDVVLLAVPFFAVPELDPEPFAGKIVMDAGNYYPQRDGEVAALDDHSTTTSEIVAKQLPGAQIVKAFNAILERDIEPDAGPRGAKARRALPIAGDDAEAKAVISDLLKGFGYDVVDAGALKEGWRFERARPAYCVPLDAPSLRAALVAADTHSLAVDGSWRD